MKKQSLRILALAMLLALAAGALSAMAEAKIVPDTLYTDYEYGWMIRFEDLPAKAKITSVESSKPSVIEVKRPDGTRLAIKKPGTSKLTVNYKVGKKSYTLKQKFTVGKYYKAVKSLKINGEKQNVTRGLGKVYCAYTDFENKKFTVKLTPVSGWKIESIRGLYTDGEEEDIILGHFNPKNNKAFKVPLNRMAYVIYTLKNAKTGETFDYNVGIIRYGE